MRMGESSAFRYYCPDKKVWEETGYLIKMSENHFDFFFR